jgi:hypothetical protein
MTAMRLRSALVFLALLAPAAALAGAAGCGDTVNVPGDGIGGAGGAGGSSSTFSGSGSGNAPPDGGADALPDYVDPGCPDAAAPIEEFFCDPYEQQGCLRGEGCFIFVDYPTEPCGPETYGAFCAPAGFGGQGEPCFGAQDCQGGFTCVITGSGTQCVQLCALEGEDGCPAGLVCEAIDVEGFGGCL